MHWPAVARRGGWIPTLHLDDREFDIELQRRNEPACHLSDRQAVAHRHGAGADETLPAGFEQQSFDGAPGRIWPIKHPHGLALARAILKQVAERRDERVYAATDVLQVDEQHIEVIEHRVAGPARSAVKTEHRDAVLRVAEIRRLDHVVLLVAAQAVLRAEGRGQS